MNQQSDPVNPAIVNLRSIGTLIKMRGDGYIIRWLDGGTATLTRDQVPPQFTDIRLGQTFECNVDRNACNWQLLRMTKVCKTQPMPPVRELEAIRLFSSQQLNG